VTFLTYFQVNKNDFISYCYDITINQMKLEDTKGGNQNR